MPARGSTINGRPNPTDLHADFALRLQRMTVAERRIVLAALQRFIHSWSPGSGLARAGREGPTEEMKRAWEEWAPHPFEGLLNAKATDPADGHRTGGSKNSARSEDHDRESRSS